MKAYYREQCPKCHIWRSSPIIGGMCGSCKGLSTKAKNKQRRIPKPEQSYQGAIEWERRIRTEKNNWQCIRCGVRGITVNRSEWNGDICTWCEREIKKQNLKMCIKCLAFKDALHDFTNYRPQWCRECGLKNRREWYQRNKERLSMERKRPEIRAKLSAYARSYTKLRRKLGLAKKQVRTAKRREYERQYKARKRREKMMEAGGKKKRRAVRRSAEKS